MLGLILPEMITNKHIAQLLQIAIDQEPDEVPHSWCLDWTLGAEKYLQEQGISIRPTRFLDQYNLRYGQGAHLWVELWDGTILDATVRQFVRDDFWILPAGHPLRALYLYAGEGGRPLRSALSSDGHPCL